MTHDHDQILGTRKLRVSGTGDQTVTVTLYLPRRKGDEWACPVRITGLDKPAAFDVLGVDAIHALQCALAGIRTYLDETGRVFTWLQEGGVSEPEGISGFPRSIPDAYGPELELRMQRLVLDEVTRFVRERPRKPELR